MASKKKPLNIPDWVNESNYQEYLDQIIQDRNRSAGERQQAIRYKQTLEHQAKEEAAYKLEAAKYEALLAKERKEQQKILRTQAEKDRFARSYMARDYISGVASHTATMVPPRRPYNLSGLRQEWQIYGYKGPSSGIVGADFHIKNPTTKTKGSLVAKGKLSTGKPAMINLDFLGVNVGGLGDVIMPTLGVLKIKGRKKL